MDNMLYSVNLNGTLLRINPSTLACTPVSGAGPGTFAYGVTYDPADHRIYCESYETQQVYSYDAVTYAGPVFDAAPTVSFNWAMTYNGSTLVVAPGSGAGETLYSYDPVSGNCTALYPTTLLDSVGLESLVYVSNVNNTDYYSVPANAGDNLSLSTATPSDGPNLFGNTLAPEINLYDPSGNLVAGGTVGTDGRNETLNYAATVTGAVRGAGHRPKQYPGRVRARRSGRYGGAPAIHRDVNLAGQRQLHQLFPHDRHCCPQLQCPGDLAAKLRSRDRWRGRYLYDRPRLHRRQDGDVHLGEQTGTGNAYHCAERRVPHRFGRRAAGGLLRLVHPRHYPAHRHGQFGVGAQYPDRRLSDLRRAPSTKQ